MPNLLSAVVNFGSSYVAIIDLIMLGIILFSLLFGAIRGFFRQVLSVLGALASIILAIIFCDELAEFIMTSIPSISDGLKGKIGELFGLTDELLAGTKEQILESLAKTSIPAFLHELLANAIIETAGDLNIVHILTKWSLVAISFVIIFLASFIIFFVIKLIFKGLTKIKVVGALDRILGAILMALKFIIGIIILITFISVFADLNPILAPTLQDGTVVNSIFNSLISWIMSLPFVQNLFIV